MLSLTKSAILGEKKGGFQRERGEKLARLETARGESQVTKSGFAFRRGEPSCPTVVVVPEAIGGVGKKMASGTLVVTPGLSDKRLDALFFFFFFPVRKPAKKGTKEVSFAP